MNNFQRLTSLCLLLMLGACETKAPEAEIGGVIRAKIDGRPWESARIVWGDLPQSERPIYPGKGNVPIDIYVGGKEVDREIYLSLNGQRNIFSLIGKLEPLYAIQKVRVGGKTYLGEATNTQIEILAADTLTRTIEGRFAFRGACCLWGPRAEEFVEVTDGYFKLMFP
jgi:hypothetical protein